MSDVDDNNLKALKDNTSSMIDLQLSRMKSTQLVKVNSQGSDSADSPSKKVMEMPTHFDQSSPDSDTPTDI